MRLEDHSGPSEIVIRCQEHRSTRVRLFAPEAHGDDELVFGMEAQADGLQARLERVEVHPWQTEYLSTFLGGLAADFRGWDGERVWRTNHLGLAATFASGGHVRLVWTLSDSLVMPDSWQASVSTWIEAGEQMVQVAEQAREFLRGW
ncbi:hypothetical protein ABH920_009112 [Catenulispora sp. EB89]|uniref:DUF6228 family protein n=1 Tax=Catenulispora sp. EB89 TaxID=3156257 RepID=UPI003515D293